MNFFFLILFLILSIENIEASENINSGRSFIAKEASKIWKIEGDVNARSTPASTFKIAIALMNFNEGILKDPETPKLSYQNDFKKDEHSEPLEIQKSARSEVTPAKWMYQSIVWYSQCIMQTLGMEKFQDYVNKFNYGNKNVSGGEKNNGLTHAWLASSLQISPKEQVEFLEAYVLNDNNVVSEKARQETKNLLLYDVTEIVGLDKDDQDKYSAQQWGGWKLYAKTGSENLSDGRQIGWLVGFIEKENRHISFANRIIEDVQEGSFVSFRAREDARVKLLELLHEIDACYK